MATMTKPRALNIISNPSAIQVCRAIALLYEEYQRLVSSLKLQLGCSSCDKAGAHFDGIRTKAFECIRDLNEPDMIRLKAFLREESLSFYIGEAPNIKRITR